MQRFLITGRQAQALAAELWHRAADVNAAEIAQRDGPYSDLVVFVRSPRGTDRFVLPPNGEVADSSGGQMTTPRCAECGGPLEGWAGEQHSQQCSQLDSGQNEHGRTMAEQYRDQHTPRLPCGCPLDSGCDGWHPYDVKCHGCRQTLRYTDSVRESAEGGTCAACKAALAAGKEA